MDMVCSLSKQDTSVLKGIAIIAMLFHHLYCSIPSGVESYGGILLWIGELGKVCVSIFLFCSGYGVAVQFDNVKGVKGTFGFTLKRLATFWLNYWIVFLIFVPISVWVFKRPLSAAYGEDFNLIKCVGFDLLGLQGVRSYNITWWFNKLIILLYLFFPFIYYFSRKRGIVVLLISLAVCRFWSYVFHFETYGYIEVFQLSFVFGVLWKKWECGLDKAICCVPVSKYIMLLGSVLVLACLVWFRLRSVIPHWTGMAMDAFVTLGLVFFLVFTLRKSKTMMTVLAFLGKHSMNVYLVHTFFNAYWFPKILHSGMIMRGGLNFIILLLVCVVVSLVLEWLKEKVGVYKLLAVIRTKINKLQ